MTDKEKITISNVWGKIPINEIKQHNCEACVFGHYASICGEIGYSNGIKKCLKMLQEKHKGANLAHLAVILRRCGADKDPWGGIEWKNYAETFKKLEQAFEADLPSLMGADLNEADFYKANLYGADLYDVDLSRSDLRGTDLRGADLRGAELSGSELSGADLRDADLRGADLSLADLRGANLSEADLRGAELREAEYNSKTIFSEGFSPEEKDMVRL